MEKYLKLVDYHIVREKAFACEDLGDFREMVEMLQQRYWVCFNNLIQETNKSIGLEFYEMRHLVVWEPIFLMCEVSILITLLVLLTLFLIFNLLMYVLLEPIEMSIG